MRNFIFLLAASLFATGAARADDGPITPGTVAIERPAGKPIAQDAAFDDAVAVALSDAGYTIVPDPGHSRFVAAVRVSREATGVARTRAPSAGADTVGGGVGASVGGTLSVGLPSGKSALGRIVATELAVRLKRRDGSVAWEGRAVTQGVAGARGNEPERIAAKLANGLFKGFPAESGLTISVP